MKTSKALAKIISLALVICMLFSMASCNLLKGKLELKSFTVDRSSIKTAYYIGEKINFTDIRAYAKYSDSSLDKEYTYSELTITYAPDITATEGQKEVKVSFQDPNLNTEVSATVLITVTEDPNAVKHDSYKVDATGMKTTYLIGDTLDFTGVKVIEKFTNGGADVEMTDLSTISYEYDSNITATSGIKTVLVKYNGENAGSISITVNRPGINEATLDTTGVTLEYLVGQTVSFTGLKATITYENGQTATVTDFTFKTDLATLTATTGEKTVIVEMVDELSGTTREASFKVKVDGVVSHSINTQSATLNYFIGDTVSFAGITVTEDWYFKADVTIPFADLTFGAGADLTATAGKKTVDVSYGGKVIGTVTVDVKIPNVQSVVLNTTGMTTEYLVGQTASLSGLTALITYANGITRTVTTFTAVTDLATITAQPGDKNITVEYVDPISGNAARDVVTIKVDGITNYTLDTAGMTLEYLENDVVSFAGIKVTAHSFYGKTAQVDFADLTFVHEDNLTATVGNKSVTVKVGDVEIGSFLIKVGDIPTASANTQGVDLSYRVGETVSLNGLTLTLTYTDGTPSEIVTNFEKVTILEGLTATAGTKTIVVKCIFEGIELFAQFDITVHGFTYKVTAPTKTDYIAGDTLDLAGLKVEKDYNDGGALVPVDFTVEQGVTATAGRKTVAVMVDGVQVGSFSINVIANDITEMALSGNPSSIRLGATPDFSGITLTLTYRNGSTVTLNYSDLQIVGDFTTAGKKTVTVNFHDAVNNADDSATFELTVYGVDHYTVDVSGMKTEYIVGQGINHAGIKVYAHYLDGGAPELVDISRLNFGDEGATATAGDKQILISVDGEPTGLTIGIKVSKNSAVSIEVGGDFDNKYKLNETTNFAGIIVTITYLDGTKVNVTDLSKLTFKDAETDKEAKFGKEVTVTLTDEINRESVSATFLMVVTDNPRVTSFEQNEDISAFESDNNPETRYEFGQNGFESQFAVGGQTYVIGDDNEFRYQPTFAVDKDGEDDYLVQYFADVTLYVDGAPLERRAVTNSVTNYEYYLGGTKIATVDTYNGKYQFHTQLANVTISVMPSSDYYEIPADIKAVTLNAKVVDAYNVYEAWQLSLIDNRDDYGDADDDNYFAWQDFRTEKGLGNLRVNGVVIHDDINITVDDIPESFITRTTEEFTYKNTVSGETVTVPVGTRFLKPITYVYSRCGGNFTIHGNFFHLSLYNTDSTDPLAYMKNFPLEPSPEAKNDAGVDYGLDFSNSVLFHGASVDYNGDAHFYISNLSLRGNAGRDNWVAEKNGATHLASAGGLLMTKSSDLGMTVHVDNVISNSFYIAYLADWGGTMNVSNVKAYNSYQNAIYVARNSTVEVRDSWFSGVGGPAIISQGNESRNDVIGYANITLTNTVLDTSLSGNELWFKMLGALSPDIEGMVQQIQGMGTLLGPLGTWLKDGKMNIKCVQLYGMDFADVTAQGYMNINGAVMDKYYSAESHYWNTILPTMQAGAGAAPFLTVIDAQGNAHTAYYNGSTLVPLGNCDMTQFMAAKDIILTKGGLSIVLEFYH